MTQDLVFQTCQLVLMHDPMTRSGRTGHARGCWLDESAKMPHYPSGIPKPRAWRETDPPDHRAWRETNPPNHADGGRLPLDRDW